MATQDEDLLVQQGQFERFVIWGEAAVAQCITK
jgi:hypothetical protein